MVSLFPELEEATPMQKGAVLSEDGLYRYKLWRCWDEDAHGVVWVMLNPSTADADIDDPTIRRCIAFARAWHAGSIAVVNLFAARATNPRALKAMPDPVGPDNDHWLRWAGQGNWAGDLVLAWGAHAPGVSRDQINRAFGWLCYRRCWCLGRTKDGHPKHPLYVPGDTRLERYTHG